VTLSTDRPCVGLLCGALLALVLAGCGADGDPSRDGGPDAPRVDARVSRCGLPLPGSVCRGPLELDRCVGTGVETVRCDAGLVCGTDPEVGFGAICLHPGDPCGVIPPDGVCSGTIRTRCDDGDLETFDCTELFGVCSESLGRCRHVCELSGVSPAGRCLSGRLLRCVFRDGTYAVEDLACPAGTVCATLAETGSPTCQPAPPCAELGPAGACDGTLLRRCEAGQQVVTDCAESGRGCV
jgi:hypothetical protein